MVRLGGGRNLAKSEVLHEADCFWAFSPTRQRKEETVDALMCGPHHQTRPPPTAPRRQPACLVLADSQNARRNGTRPSVPRERRRANRAPCRPRLPDLSAEDSATLGKPRPSLRLPAGVYHTTHHVQTAGVLLAVCRHRRATGESRTWRPGCHSRPSGSCFRIHERRACPLVAEGVQRSARYA